MSGEGRSNGKVRATKALAVVASPQSSAAEAFRTLRTSLQWLDPGSSRVLALTGPEPDAGTTTCAANLAAALAYDGRRVLLVDANLRRPGLHRLFRLKGAPGLSQLLAAGCGDEAIQSTGVDGLDLLAGGPVPTNPAELLGMAILEQALIRWSEAYDHVLFDTPPLLAVADSLVVARRARHALLVARASSTRDRRLQKAMDLLSDAGVEVLGAVLNDMRGRGADRFAYAARHGRP